MASLHHVLPGVNVDEAYKDRFYPHENLPVVVRTLGPSYSRSEVLEYAYQNPSVVWAGASGYWCETDLNNLIEIQGKE